MRMNIPIQIRDACFHPLKWMLASGSHLITTVPFGYLRLMKEKETMIVSKSFVYESNIKVARVAMGFFIPNRYENFDERELAEIITMTRIIM